MYRVHRRLKTWQHVYRTIAKEAGVDDLLASFLLGHSPTGISQRYLSMLVLRSGPAMRSAQRAVSKRIVALLGQAYMPQRWTVLVSTKRNTTRPQ